MSCPTAGKEKSEVCQIDGCVEQGVDRRIGWDTGKTKNDLVDVRLVIVAWTLDLRLIDSGQLLLCCTAEWVRTGVREL